MNYFRSIVSCKKIKSFRNLYAIINLQIDKSFLSSLKSLLQLSENTGFQENLINYSK